MSSRRIDCRLSPLSATLSVWLLIGAPVTAVQQWNNSATGGAAGSWFTASNWSPAVVPNSTLEATINNGGEARATSNATPISALLLNVGKNGGAGFLTVSAVNTSIQQSIDIGVVDGLFATGTVTVNANGHANIADASSVAAGLSGIGDINAGQTSATNGAVANGTGTVTIERVTHVTMAGDYDLGQASGTGTATGNGTGTVRDVTGQFMTGGDLDVGQTSAMPGGINRGTGQLTAERIANLQVGVDFDIGQSTGSGQSTSHGNVTMNSVTNLTIGDSLDIAKVRALNTAVNSGNGNATFTGGSLSIGFAATNPGSIEIARVLVSETARGNAAGTLVLNNANIQVANDVIVAELALGSPNAANSANGTLRLSGSLLTMRDLSIAQRFNSTAGMMDGTLVLNRSLVTIGSVLSLGQDSTVSIELDGVTRATAVGGTGVYSAINTESALLNGILQVIPNAAYLGPSTRGASDQFQLIASLLGLSGGFDTVSYDGTQIGTVATYVGQSQSGVDGLFASVAQTTADLVLTNYLALPGDANGDRVVDGSDFSIWNANKFTPGRNWSQGDFNGDGIVDGSDFGIWNANKFTSAVSANVPEAGYLSWFLLLLVTASPYRSAGASRTRRVSCPAWRLPTGRAPWS